MTKRTLENLFPEIWVEIGRYLSASEVFKLKMLSKALKGQISNSPYSSMLLQPYLNKLKALDPSIKVTPAPGQTAEQLFVVGFEQIKKQQLEERAYLISKHENSQRQNIKDALAPLREISEPKTLEALIEHDRLINHLNIEIIKSRIFTNRTALYLPRVGITRFPSELFEEEAYKLFFHNLKILKCEENELKNLPEEIAILLNLKELDCSNNKLKSLPKEMGNLIKLKTLSVHRNLLQNIPKEMGNCIALKELYIYKNKLKTLPIELQKCKNLKWDFYLGAQELELLPLVLLKKFDLGRYKREREQSRITNLTILTLLTAVPVIMGDSMTIFKGLLALSIWSSYAFFTGRYLRDKFKEKEYFAYDAKTESEMIKLTDTQKQSFEIGLEASKSYQTQFSGLFKWQAYRSPKAYYAGLDQDNELINKVIRPRV